MTSAMSLQESDQILVADELRDGIGVHLKSLAEQHLHPALFGEQLLQRRA